MDVGWSGCGECDDTGDKFGDEVDDVIGDTVGDEWGIDQFDYLL
jgi:hypothetical protein